MRRLKHKCRLVLLTAIFVLTGLACAIPGLGADLFSEESGRPDVAIASPAEGIELEAGRELNIESVSIDSTGVVRVELVVNGQVIWVDANANPEPDTPFIVAQPWTPASPGTHVIRVRAYNSANAAGESPPLTIQVVSLTAASATPTVTRDAPTPTVVALADTVSPSPTRTVAPTPSGTPKTRLAQSSPSPTVTATATATPKPRVFTPTGLEPDGRFKEIWIDLGSGQGRLGYPTGPAIADRNYAKQFFEAGLMFWWDNPADSDDIWVMDSATADFSSGATSNRYADTWQDGDEHSCDEARNGGPIRGFGKLWCERHELQTRLGFPTEPESGSGGRPPYAQVQFFQGGLMIYNPINSEVYVLFGQGDWQRFEY